jgi:ATP-dependent Clp protease protease subunit
MIIPPPTPSINTSPRSRRADEDESISSNVSVLHDHIYFYAPVTPESAMELNRTLQDLSMRLAPTAFSSMQEIGSPSPIWLHINSYGGEVFSSFAIADTIERISQIVPVVTIVEGCAASGATFMSVAGKKRLMRKNGFMLVHELNDRAWGRFTELKDNMTSNVEIMKTIKAWYKEKTKIPDAEMDKILAHDIWWNAKKCLKYGLIDAII